MITIEWTKKERSTQNDLTIFLIFHYCIFFATLFFSFTVRARRVCFGQILSRAYGRVRIHIHLRQRFFFWGENHDADPIRQTDTAERLKRRARVSYRCPNYSLDMIKIQRRIVTIESAGNYSSFPPWTPSHKIAVVPAVHLGKEPVMIKTHALIVIIHVRLSGNHRRGRKLRKKKSHARITPAVSLKKQKNDRICSRHNSELPFRRNKSLIIIHTGLNGHVLVQYWRITCWRALLPGVRLSNLEGVTRSTSRTLHTCAFCGRWEAQQRTMIDRRTQSPETRDTTAVDKICDGNERAGMQKLCCIIIHKLSGDFRR